MSACPKPVLAKVAAQSAQVLADMRAHSIKSWVKLLDEAGITETEWLAERNRLLTDLKHWCKTIFSLTLGGKLLTPQVHGKLITELEARMCFVEDRPQLASFNLWLQARDTLKTSLFVAESLQSVMRDKDEYLGVGTYRQDESNRRCQMMADKLASQTCQLYFPDSVWLPGEKKPQGVRYKTAVMDLKNRRAVTAGTIQALSRESAQTGLHFTRVLCDDLVNEESIASSKARSSCEDTWNYLSAAVTASVLFDIVGTPYADDDLYAELKARRLLSFEWIVPAVMTDYWLETFPEMQERLGFKKYEVGDLCFPNRLPAETLEQKRLMHGPRVFASQFLLEPSKETSQLKDEWLQVFVLGDEPAGLWYYMTADPSASEKEGSSEGAICLSGWDYIGQMWIVDFEAGLWSPDEFTDRFCAMYARWQHKGIKGAGMENISFQRYAHRMIPKVAKDHGVTIRMDTIPGHHLGIYGRIDNLVTAASAHWVHVAAHLIPLIATQWKAFPDPTGKRMDRLDAIAAQYARYTKGPLKNKTWVRLPPKPEVIEEQIKDLREPSERPHKDDDEGDKPWWA